MKNSTYILPIFLSIFCFTSCEKENLIQDNSPTSYMNSRIGETLQNLEVEIYHVTANDSGTCEGYFLNLIDYSCDHLVEVSLGIPDSILTLSNLENQRFIVNLEYLGLAYNCNQSYTKKPSIYGNGSPVEIQKVKVTQITFR